MHHENDWQLNSGVHKVAVKRKYMDEQTMSERRRGSMGKLYSTQTCYPIGDSRRKSRLPILLLMSASLAALCSCDSPRLESASNKAATSSETPIDKKIEAQVAAVTPSDWSESVTNSGIDGKIITRTKTFSVAQGASTVVTKVTCLPDTKKLTISLESYGPDASIPSSFVTERTAIAGLTVPSGRLKLGKAEPIELGRAFQNDKYSNVIAWNLSDAAESYIAAEYAGRFNAAQTAFAEKHPAGSSYDNDMAMDAWTNEHNRLERAKLDTAKKAYASGNFLSSALPIVVEANNQQGTFEIQIPKDDAGLGDLIGECSRSGLTAGQLNSIFGFGGATPPSPSTESPSHNDGIASGGSSEDVASEQMANSSTKATQVSVQPSFDCSKAYSLVERLICATPDLALADNSMSVAYKQAYASAGSNASSVRQGQRDFISKRNQCTTVECVAEAYRARYEQLGQLGYVRE